MALGLREEESNEFLGLGIDDGLANVNEEHAMALSFFEFVTCWFGGTNNNY